MAATVRLKMSWWLFLAFCRAVASAKPYRSQPEPWIRGTRLLQHWISSLYSTPSDWNAKIPPQLLIISKSDSFMQMPQSVQANLANILDSSPGVKLRWMGDSACRTYLQVHYDRELLSLFQEEEHNPYRTDLCRTAVLLREGGFYADLDVELTTSLGKLADSRTTFMSVYSEHSHTAMDGLLAAVPGSPVLNATLKEMRKWYRHADMRRNLANDKTADQHMGSLALLRGIRRAMREHCPESTVDANMADQWTCGEQVFRFLRERRMDCQTGVKTGFQLPRCGNGRAKSSLEEHRIGLFQVTDTTSPLVGWSHGAWCVDSNCGDQTRWPLGKQPLHTGSLAFWPLLIGFISFAVVFPNMVFGFADFFCGARSAVMGPRFCKGKSNKAEC